MNAKHTLISVLEDSVGTQREATLVLVLLGIDLIQTDLLVKVLYWTHYWKHCYFLCHNKELGIIMYLVVQKSRSIWKQNTKICMIKKRTCQNWTKLLIFKMFCFKEWMLIEYNRIMLSLDWVAYIWATISAHVPIENFGKSNQKHDISL